MIYMASTLLCWVMAGFVCGLDIRLHRGLGMEIGTGITCVILGLFGACLWVLSHEREGGNA